MSLAMSPTEREAFLADVHVGVLSAANGDRGPLSVPVWYTYEPGGLLSFITGRSSQKAQRIQAAGRFSVCAQTETAPYKYVSVEGPVVAGADPIDPAERRDLAHRYLGTEFGDLYLAATEADVSTNVTDAPGALVERRLLEAVRPTGRHRSALEVALGPRRRARPQPGWGARFEEDAAADAAVPPYEPRYSSITLCMCTRFAS